jgi:hypothetical protein
VFAAFPIAWSSMLSQPSPKNSQKVTPTSSTPCGKLDPDPLGGVANPLRFRIISNCVVASGVVKTVPVTPDYFGGVKWVDVGLDAQYTQLLGAGNRANQSGLMVLGLAPDQAMINEQSVGHHIIIVGTLVYDMEKQWNAMYPVRSIAFS